jgi:hypothetical protein
MRRSIKKMALKAAAVNPQIRGLISGLPEEQRLELFDTIIDWIEKKNADNEDVLMACDLARQLLGVPDEEEETDQTKPI